MMAYSSLCLDTDHIIAIFKNALGQLTSTLKWSGACEHHIGDHWTRAAMSNPNGLLSRKLCHYLNQGCTLNKANVLKAFKC